MMSCSSRMVPTLETKSGKGREGEFSLKFFHRTIVNKLLYEQLSSPRFVLSVLPRFVVKQSFESAQGKIGK